MRECPRCFKQALYRDDALNCLSRRDNQTYICQICGTEEALIDAGMIQDELAIGVDRIFTDKHKPSKRKAKGNEVME